MPSIPQVSQQISQLSGTGPSLGESQLFGQAITDLLKSYQKIEKYPFLGQQLNAQDAQAKRLSFTDPNLIGAAPSVQAGVRSASVSALQPTVSGAEQAGQTFASRLQTFGDVLNQGRQIQQQAEASALQAKADAKDLITSTIANFGPDAFNGVDPKELQQLEKLAGVPAGYINDIAKALKAREAAQQAASHYQAPQQAQGPNGELLVFKGGRYYNADGTPYTGQTSDISSPVGNTQSVDEILKNTSVPNGNTGFKRTKKADGGYDFTDLAGHGHYSLDQIAQFTGLSKSDLLAGSTNPNDLSIINSDQGKASANLPSGYKQYGLLATTDYNPQSSLDVAAKSYLDYYIKNGTYPTYYALFGRSTLKSGNKLTEIAQRAQDLFYSATGSALPDVNILKSNKALISGNNKLLNGLRMQEGTVGANFKLAVDNLNKNSINQSAQPINAFLNSIKNLMGDPAVAQYLTQNGTVQNEVSNLISIKNATGTTVADKLISAGLIPKNASEAQQKAILGILLKEAQNAQAAIASVNNDLYATIDPLETDQNNPNRILKLGGGSQNSSSGTTSSGLGYTIIK